MEQFTASEVRAEAHRHANEVEDMLNAFADMLEAREKAVPVGYISADDIRELDANREDDAECAEAIEMLIASRPFASNHTAIYTHPAPSDAGEAIRIHPDVAKAQAIPFDVNDGRPTRSAQAQPPVQSEYAPTYPNQAQDPFWTVPGMVDTRPKTHGTQARPAARVTDAMVNAAMRADFCGHNVADALMCGTDWNTEVMRAALEAALAAQENPNG